MASKSSKARGASKHGRRQRRRAANKHVPDPDFPLSVHRSSRRYYKTIRGHRHYFGSLEDGSSAALEKWLAVRDELMAGPDPAAWRTDENATVADVVNAWLAAQHEKADAGDTLPSTFTSYYAVGRVVAD